MKDLNIAYGTMLAGLLLVMSSVFLIKETNLIVLAAMDMALGLICLWRSIWVSNTPNFGG